MQKNEVRLQELAAAEAQVRAKMEHLRETSQAEITAKDGISVSLSDRRYRLAVLIANIEASEKEIRSNQAQIAALEESNLSAAAYVDQVHNAIDGMYQTMNETIVDTALQEEMTALTEQIASSGSLKAQLDADFQCLTDDRMRLSTELESLRGTIDKEEYILSKIDDDLLQLQQRYRKNTALPILRQCSTRMRITTRTQVRSAFPSASRHC